MIGWLKRLFETREERVLRVCGCVCRCPQCKDILNDQGEVHASRESAEINYFCSSCGCWSVWDFDAPVPLLKRTIGSFRIDARDLDE